MNPKIHRYWNVNELIFTWPLHILKIWQRTIALSYCICILFFIFSEQLIPCNTKNYICMSYIWFCSSREAFQDWSVCLKIENVILDDHTIFLFLASHQVCRFCQQQDEKQACFICGTAENLWVCVICGFLGCGRLLIFPSLLIYSKLTYSRRLLSAYQQNTSWH